MKKITSIVFLFVMISSIKLIAQEQSELFQLVSGKILRCTHLYVTGFIFLDEYKVRPTGSLDIDETRYYDFSFDKDGTGSSDSFYNDENHYNSFFWEIEEVETYTITIQNTTLELKPPYIRYDSGTNSESIIRLIRDSTGMLYLIFYSSMPDYNSQYQLIYRIKSIEDITTS